MKFFSATNKDKPKKKKRKIGLVVFGSILVIILSYVSYLYATGSRVFDKGLSGDSGLFSIIKGEQSDIFKQDRVNILVMGRGGENHPGGLLTDSLMIFSIKPKEKKMAMISIPRDLYVPINNHGSGKINSAFADGYNDYLQKDCKKKVQSQCLDSAMAAGANLTRQTVSNVFEIPIHFYVSVDFVGFQKLIDELGGVDVYVEKAIYDPSYPDERMVGYSTFSIKAGQQHLDGKTALKYARSRESTSDFDRARRQQLILRATKEKAMKAGVFANPKKILDIVAIVGNHVRTDMSASDIKSLADTVKEVDSANIINKVLDNGPDGHLYSDSSSGTFYLMAKVSNFSVLRQIAKNIFSTANTVDIKIAIENGSKTAGLGEKLSVSLKKLGYNVVSVTTSTEKYKQTILYSYLETSENDLVDELKLKLNCLVVSKKPSENQTAQIKIIVGDDYKGIE
jgi:polyisoprenyl-teichoic acid--peptidoglycan teichoic acid transferase